MTSKVLLSTEGARTVVRSYAQCASLRVDPKASIRIYSTRNVEGKADEPEGMMNIVVVAGAPSLVFPLPREIANRVLQREYRRAEE